MLWHIKGSNTYLLGTVHLTNFAPPKLSAAAEIAFNRATQIVFETDVGIDQPPDPRMLNLPDGVMLSTIVSRQLYEMTKAHWIRLGGDEQGLLKRLPGMTAIALQFTTAALSGYARHNGVDKTLWVRAKSEGKQIVMLETFDEQMSKLVTSPLVEQIELLKQTAEDPACRVSQVIELVDAWNTNGIGVFERELARAFAIFPKMSETIITERNEDWRPSIRKFVESETPTLVAVGALHLVGEVGLPEILKKDGFVTVPVTQA